MQPSERNITIHSTKPPCKDCPQIGCGDYHMKCEKYLQYKESIYKAKLKEKELAEITHFRGMKGCSIRHRLKRQSNNYYIHKVNGGAVWR